MKAQTIAKITLWINRVVAAVVAVMMVALPALHRWYAGLLHYPVPDGDVWGLWVAYVCCALIILTALWNMEKLLQNMLVRKVFIQENVRRVRRVQWCCGLVAILCLAAAFFALPALLIAAIMGFLCLVVSVVVCVLENAVALREENDLTI